MAKAQPEEQQMGDFDWTAATEELMRQFPELGRYAFAGVAHSLAYAVARGNGETGYPPIPDTQPEEKK